MLIKTDTTSTENQRELARRIVRNLIWSGKLLRGYCWCGNIGEAHHENYLKPLLIYWLCPPHHKARHRIKARSIPDDHDQTDLSDLNAANSETIYWKNFIEGKV